MLKSKRWPWLTDGWEVVEDVKYDSIAEDLLGRNKEPAYFDISYIHRPADIQIKMYNEHHPRY